MANQNLELALKIKALVEGVNNVKGLANDVQKLQGQAKTPLGDPTVQMRKGIKETSTQALGLKNLLLTVLGIAGVQQGLTQLGRMADAYKQFNAQIKLGIGDQGDMAMAQAEVGRIANDNLVSLEAIGKLYGRMASPILRLGKSQEEVGKTTEVMALALRISGATAQESASAILQFSQSMASGTLRGEEFNAVNEAAPRLMLALAESLGVPREALRGMAENGLLTSELLATALPKALGTLRAEAATLPTTVGGAFQVMKNQMLDAIGQADKAAGISAKVANVVIGVANNLSVLASVVAGILTAAFSGLAVSAAASIGGIAVKLRVLLALIGGPVGLVVSLAAAALAWLSFRKSATAELDAVIAKQRELNALTGKGLSKAEATDPRKVELAALNSQLAAKRAELAEAEKVTAKRITSASAGTPRPEWEPINQTRRTRLREEIALAEQAIVRLQAVSAKSDSEDAAREAEIQRLLAEAKANAGKDKGTDGTAAAKKAADEARRVALAELGLKVELSEQTARLEQDDLERQIAANKQAFDDKLIDARDYYTALSEFQRQQADSEIRLLEAQRAAAQSVGGGKAEQLKAQAEVARINADIELVERRVAQQQIDNARLRVKSNIDAVNSAQALIDSIEQEAFSLGLTNDEQARAIALLELEKLAVGLTADEYEKLRDALNAALDSRQAAAARRTALEDAKKQAEDIRTALTENLQRSIADVLNTGFTGDGARGAIKGFVDLIRTSLSNVIAANLTDSILNSFSSETLTGVGKFLGLGGKKDGSTPGSAIYVQDVAAAKLTTVGGSDGEGGGLFGGFFETIKGFFSSLASGLSGLFSGLMNGLSGLFSGGGGGAGGLFSAIASVFGFADGGYTGPGGKYQPAGVVHAGEFVFSQAAVKNLGLPALSLLHRLASGIGAPSMPRLSYADGGLVNLPGAAAPVVNSSTRILNFFDLDSAMSDYLKTRGGERAILNIIQRNPGAVGA